MEIHCAVSETAYGYSHVRLRHVPRRLPPAVHSPEKTSSPALEGRQPLLCGGLLHSKRVLSQYRFKRDGIRYENAIPDGIILKRERFDRRLVCLFETIYFLILLAPATSTYLGQTCQKYPRIKRTSWGLGREPQTPPCSRRVPPTCWPCVLQLA